MFGISDFIPSFISKNTKNDPTRVLMYACFAFRLGSSRKRKVWLVIAILKLNLYCSSIKCSTSCQSFLVNMKVNRSEFISVGSDYRRTCLLCFNCRIVKRHRAASVYGAI